MSHKIGVKAASRALDTAHPCKSHTVHIHYAQCGICGQCSLSGSGSSGITPTYAQAHIAPLPDSDKPSVRQAGFSYVDASGARCGDQARPIGPPPPQRTSRRPVSQCQVRHDGLAGFRPRGCHGSRSPSRHGHPDTVNTNRAWSQASPATTRCRQQQLPQHLSRLVVLSRRNRLELTEW